MTDRIACERCGKEYEPTEVLRRLCPVCLFAQAVPESAATSNLSSARFVPPKLRDLAPHFPHLELLELAGHGGMSAVYKARHTHLDRIVAVKLLPQEIAESNGGLERFQREAQTLAALSHPNIVNVHDAGQAGPWCFIVMEYVDGPNLRQLLGDSNLPSSDVLRIASEICDGLQYAHDHNVVHRDVKPENVLIDREGRVKLADFGLARLLNPLQSSATQTGQVLGTPHYLAPEQIETPADVDHRADVYSLGVLIYEMLTGELPIGHFEPPSRRIGSDPSLDAVVLRAMSRDRQQRYQRAQDVQDGMASASEAGPTTTISTGRPAWQLAINELFLSVCSIVFGLVGCFVAIVVTGNMQTESGNMQTESGGSPRMNMWTSESVSEPPTHGRRPHKVDQYSTPTETSALRILPVPVWWLGAFVACLSSFLIARANVSSKSHWRDLSLPQNLCVPNLLIAYAILGCALLLGPGLLLLLLGKLPLIVDFEYWTFLGQNFEAGDKLSFLTAYWLRLYGAAMVTSAAWSIGLAYVIRVRPTMAQRLFHPSNETITPTLVRTALTGSACLGPTGCVLLYASLFAIS